MCKSYMHLHYVPVDQNAHVQRLGVSSSEAVRCVLMGGFGGGWDR